MYALIVIYVAISIVTYVFSKAQNPLVSKQVKQFYLNSIFLLLSLIMGLRGVSVGTDTESYQQIFHRIASSPVSLDDIGFFNDSIEIGFLLYTKVLSLICNDYQFFLLISAFIFCFLMKRFIEYSTKDYFIASVIFFSIGIYLAAFNIYRQMLAVAFVTNGWIFFSERNYIKAVLVTVLAVTFHVSAIIYFLVYLAYYFKDNRIVMRVAPLMMVVVLVSFNFIIANIAPYIEHYRNYIGNQKTIQDANFVMILWLIECLVSLAFIYKPSMPPLRQFVGNMCLMYVLMNLIGLSFNYIERFGLYFAPFLILLFCNFSDVIKNRVAKDVLFLGMVTCFLVYFIMSTSSEQYLYVSPLLNIM